MATSYSGLTVPARDYGEHTDIDVKFTEHIYKIVHTGHSRTALIIKCFHTRNPEVFVKVFVLMCVLS